MSGHKLSNEDYDALAAAATCDGGWRPWRGMYGRAERLTKAGLLLWAGHSVMPPHRLYILSETGRAALTRHRQGE